MAVVAITVVAAVEAEVVVAIIEEVGVDTTQGRPLHTAVVGAVVTGIGNVRGLTRLGGTINVPNGGGEPSTAPVL